MTTRIAAPPNRRPAAMHTVATRRMESPDLSRAHSPASRIPNRVCRQEEQSRDRQTVIRAKMCAVVSTNARTITVMTRRDSQNSRHYYPSLPTSPNRTAPCTLTADNGQSREFHHPTASAQSQSPSVTSMRPKKRSCREPRLEARSAIMRCCLRSTTSWCIWAVDLITVH